MQTNFATKKYLTPTLAYLPRRGARSKRWYKNSALAFVAYNFASD